MHALRPPLYGSRHHNRQPCVMFGILAYAQSLKNTMTLGDLCVEVAQMLSFWSAVPKSPLLSGVPTQHTWATGYVGDWSHGRLVTWATCYVGAWLPGRLLACEVVVKHDA